MGISSSQRAAKAIAGGLFAGLLSCGIPTFPAHASEHALFNEVWQNVKENYYDGTFNGVDWDELRTRFLSFPSVWSLSSQAFLPPPRI
jgi:superoxide dismutase